MCNVCKQHSYIKVTLMHIVKCMLLRNIGNAHQKHVSSNLNLLAIIIVIWFPIREEFPCKEPDCGYIRNTPHQLVDHMVRHKGVKCFLWQSVLPQA